jgi:hypothetical protein
LVWINDWLSHGIVTTFILASRKQLLHIFILELSNM